MKNNDKNIVFICQVVQGVLKIAKCLRHGRAPSQCVALEVFELSADAEGKENSRKLEVFSGKLGYAGAPVIICLPRNQVTCRYIKIPAQSPAEIESIVSLQAARFLPYPPDELITGFEIISADKEGYAHINLVIAHKDSVERYIKIFQELKPAKISVFLSSYGICNLYNYFSAGISGTAMILDMDSAQAELVVVSEKKMLFSRSFRCPASGAGWEALLADEIRKTGDAYRKEFSCQMPDKIKVICSGKRARELEETVRKVPDLPLEIFSYAQEGKLISKEASDRISDFEYSFAGLIGLGSGEVEETLNLLPQGLKKEVKKSARHKEILRTAAYVAGIIFILGVSMAKGLSNKEEYLKQLKGLVNKIAKEAKPLEEIEKRSLLLEKRLQKKPSGLELIYAVSQVLPEQVSLVSLMYEESGQLILHGQAQELKTVFDFFSSLDKTPELKNFTTKVKYATSRKTRSGDFVDFEIMSLKK